MTNLVDLSFRSSLLPVIRRGLLNQDPPLAWCADVVDCIEKYKKTTPCKQLAEDFVNHLLHVHFLDRKDLDSGLPDVLHHAIAADLVSSSHLLSLFVAKLVPARRKHPLLYKAFLQFSSTFAFCIPSPQGGDREKRLAEAINEALLDERDEATATAESAGPAKVRLILALVTSLMRATMEDWRAWREMPAGNGFAAEGPDEPPRAPMERMDGKPVQGWALSSWPSDSQGAAPSNMGHMSPASLPVGEGGESMDLQGDGGVGQVGSNPLEGVAGIDNDMEIEDMLGELMMRQERTGDELATGGTGEVAGIEGPPALAAGHADKALMERPPLDDLMGALEVEGVEGAELATSGANTWEYGWHALKLVIDLVQDARTSRLLRVAKRHLQGQWGVFIQALSELENLTTAPAVDLPEGAPQAIAGLVATLETDAWQPGGGQLAKLPLMTALRGTAAQTFHGSNGWGFGGAGVWAPLDLIMEDLVEGRRLPPFSPPHFLAGTIVSLKAAEGASWQSTITATWLSALRLVARGWGDSKPPHLEMRLSVALSILPKALAVIQLEPDSSGLATSLTDMGEIRQALATSMDLISTFEALLVPPGSVTLLANHAAALSTAAMNFPRGEESPAEGSRDGNMRDLAVEACIARGLLDQSARIHTAKLPARQLANAAPPLLPETPWTALMGGTTLSKGLWSSLSSTPARSVAELERAYEIATAGPEEVRTFAAAAICGASLLHSWHIQEHAAAYVVRLLQPPPSLAGDHLETAAAGGGSATWQQFIGQAPIAVSVLSALTQTEALNIVWLHGKVPELVAALLPLCEIFGSLPVGNPRTSLSSDSANGSGQAVFSLALLLLIRILEESHFPRSNPPLSFKTLSSLSPLELCLGSHVTLPRLIFLYNVHAQREGAAVAAQIPDSVPDLQSAKLFGAAHPNSSPPPDLSLDDFPQLKAWYSAYATNSPVKSGIAAPSTPPTSAAGTSEFGPVVDRLLAMMMKQAAPRPLSGGTLDGKGPLSRWDVVLAAPACLEAVLLANAHGHMSSRDAVACVRELMDFTPAAIGPVSSFLTAEAIRGMWAMVPTNGVDWPNPGGSLMLRDADIRTILKKTGTSRCPYVTGPAMDATSIGSLPLPLALLMSVIISLKVDVQLPARYVLGRAAASCPHPTLQTVCALWAMKNAKWHHAVLVDSAARVVAGDRASLCHLIDLCFSCVVPPRVGRAKPAAPPIASLGALLGSASPSVLGARGVSNIIEPGGLLIQAASHIVDPSVICPEILHQVARAANVSPGLSQKRRRAGPETLELPELGLRCLQLSLVGVACGAAQAAGFGATLIYVTGGTSLVQNLLLEALPRWFTSEPAGWRLNSNPLRDRTAGSNHNQSKQTANIRLEGATWHGGQAGGGSILVGTALARLTILSGALAWGPGEPGDLIGSDQSQKGTHQAEEGSVAKVQLSKQMQLGHVLSRHLEFLVAGTAGRIAVACSGATWRAYVISVAALLATAFPRWIPSIDVEPLAELAAILHRWCQPALGLAILELGGSSALSAAADFALR